jgi:hypothetical protein
MSCELFTPDVEGGCCWCRASRDQHRFVPCRQCWGFPWLPDPTDRSRVDMDLRKKVRCGCVWGWYWRESGKPAEAVELEDVGWRRMGAREVAA